MSDVGAPAGATGSGPRQVQLNPERAPALIAKYQKMLGKDLEKIQVEYKPSGVTVWVWGLGEFTKKNDSGVSVGYTVAEFKSRKSEAAKPSDQDALTAFKNKWEIRLNLPFPTDANLSSAEDSAIQAFLAKCPFNQRRAMLMSNKQFKTAYPEGFR